MAKQSGKKQETGWLPIINGLEKSQKYVLGAIVVCGLIVLLVLILIIRLF